MYLIKKRSRFSARQGSSGPTPSSSTDEDSEEVEAADAAGADMEADSAVPAAGGAQKGMTLT
jgi:hypothetical protein